MNLKSEKLMDQAVTKTNHKWLNKALRWGKHALLATTSAFAIASGLVGTSQQMYAQRPQEYVTVNASDLGAYLASTRGGQTQQQYAKVYEYRDNYRQQRQASAQAAYGSPQWLQEHNYVYDPYLSQNLDYSKFIGAFLDYNSLDRYGCPRNVVYLPTDIVHNKPISINIDGAMKMAEYPGGDTLGIYLSPTGTDINNPENNPSWGGYGYGGQYRPHTRVGQKIQGAFEILDGIGRIVRSNGRR